MAAPPRPQRECVPIAPHARPCSAWSAFRGLAILAGVSGLTLLQFAFPGHATFTILHVFLCHLCIFLGEMSVTNQVVFLGRFRSSLLILNNSLSSAVSFADIVSQSVAYLCIFFSVCCRAEVFHFGSAHSPMFSFMRRAFAIVPKN